MATIRFVLLAGLLSVVCAACRPATPGNVENEPSVPDLPRVADAGLQQKLFTLRQIVGEYAKLSDPSVSRDEKTSGRLALLRQGFDELEKQCRADLGVAGGDTNAVKDFLDRCTTTIHRN